MVGALSEYVDFMCSLVAPVIEAETVCISTLRWRGRIGLSFNMQVLPESGEIGIVDLVKMVLQDW